MVGPLGVGPRFPSQRELQYRAWSFGFRRIPVRFKHSAEGLAGFATLRP